MDTPPTPPLRKRMRRWEGTASARFVTFSCYRRLPLLGTDTIRDLFADRLAATRQQHGLQLFAWVVMPEHAHLLVRPMPGTSLADALRSLKTSVAKRAIARWRELGAPILEQLRIEGDSVAFWQRGGGFDRNVRDMTELCREVRYIHLNPVERGLVKAPEDWKWSSVRWWMGARDDEIECDPSPGDPRSWERWQGFR